MGSGMRYRSVDHSSESLQNQNGRAKCDSWNKGLEMSKKIEKKRKKIPPTFQKEKATMIKITIFAYIL